MATNMKVVLANLTTGAVIAEAVLEHLNVDQVISVPTTIVVGSLTLTDFIARVNAVDPEVEAIKAAVAALIAQLQSAADPSIYADTITALQAFLASL